MSDVFIGQVLLTGFGFAPKGFALCNGQLLPIAQNQALFSLLGTTYGGNGQTTFALPDMRGRTPLGMDGAYPLGQTGGQETVTLETAQMPKHQHTFLGTTAAATQRPPTNALYAKSSGESLYATSSAQVTLNAQTIGKAGLNVGHANMQPYQAVSFAIALSGIFPSRS